MGDDGPSETARRVAAHRLDFTRVPTAYGDPGADDALAADAAAGHRAPASRMHDYLAARTAFFDRLLAVAHPHPSQQPHPPQKPHLPQKPRGPMRCCAPRPGAERSGRYGGRWPPTSSSAGSSATAPNRIVRLRDALHGLVGRLDQDLPDCLPILNADLRSRIPELPPRAEHTDPAGLPMSALLSRFLLTFGELADQGSPPGHPAALPDGAAPRRLPRRQLTPHSWRVPASPEPLRTPHV